MREGDIREAASLAGLCDGVDTVYHLAAVIVSHDASVFRRVNRDGTANVVRRSVARAACATSSTCRRRRSPTRAARRTPSPSCEAEGIVAAPRALAHTIVRPTLVYDETGGQELMLFLDYLRRFPVVPFIGNGQRAQAAGLVRTTWSTGSRACAGNPIALGKTYNLSGAEADLACATSPGCCSRHHGRRAPVRAPAGAALPRAGRALGALVMKRAAAHH